MELGFNFQETLILLLIGVLFFKEQLWSVIEKRLGIKSTGASAKMDRLEQYFNHDTTAHHSKTHDMLGRLIEMEEKEHEEAGKFRETLTNINNTLGNIEKYGIKCRSD